MLTQTQIQATPKQTLYNLFADARSSDELDMLLRNANRSFRGFFMSEIRMVGRLSSLDRHRLSNILARRHTPLREEDRVWLKSRALDFLL